MRHDERYGMNEYKMKMYGKEKLESKATKIEVKWGNTVYETIGVAYYTHYYYDNLRDFQDAYNLAKSLKCDLTGNLDSFRLVIKDRRTLEDYVKYKEEEE